MQRAWPQCPISLDVLSCFDGLSIWSGSNLQSFGDNYVAGNSDGDPAARAAPSRENRRAKVFPPGAMVNDDEAGAVYVPPNVVGRQQIDPPFAVWS